MNDPNPGEEIGKLRVWNIINPPNEPKWIPVESPHAAKVLIDGLTEAQLQIPNIHSNAFGLVEWDGEEWAEWYSEDDKDIDEWEYIKEEHNGS